MLANNPSAANGYVFYDCETTGVSRCYDQILQIAAIRSDGDFNIVDPEHDILNLRCRRLPWITPSPGAMLVTGVTHDQLERAPLSHYEMMQTVAATYENWAPATFIGYNSMRFDEELLRHGLFSTLNPPYITSQRGCGRADVYRMLQVVAALAPGVIALPEIGDRPSMKLGNVLRANGIVFSADEAHDALADVRGTIALLKLMRQRCPTIVEHMLMMASRDVAATFLDENPIMRHVTHFGAPHVATVKSIAKNPENKNEVAIFDLAFDPAPYLEMSVDELVDALRSLPRVISSIRLNAQPAFLPREALLDETVERGPDHIDDYTIEARAISISLAHQFQDNVAEAMQLLQRRYIPGPYIEEQLYSGGFPSFADKRLAARFHRITDWRQRLALINEFGDARLRTHALRLIYCEAPGALPSPVLDEMHDWTRERLLSLDDNLPFLTIHSACEELESITAMDSKNDENPVPIEEGEWKNQPGASAPKTVAESLGEIREYYLMLASGHQ